MFHKAFKVKSNTTVKGSDRKKWRSQLEEKFPNLTTMDLTELIPNKDVNVAKLFTHNGEAVNVLSVQKNPLFFEVQGIVYPTVYMLWRFPDLIPAFTTWSDVLPKLCRGADLMLPGVILPEGNNFGPASFGNLQKGDMCAVNLITNKACIAVGKTALSSEDMYMSGKRGKGVIMLHTYTDQLWSLGDKSAPPNLPPPFERNLISSDFVNSTEAVKSELGNKGTVLDPCSESFKPKEVMDDSKVSETSSVDPSDVAVKNLGTLSIDGADNEICKVSEEQGDRSENGELRPDANESPTAQFESSDSLLMYCFLKAWKTCAKDVELPLLTSTFYKAHLLASVPPGCSLDIKKTTYKKFSKFLAAMQEKGLIKVKELSKGVESITEVNPQHPELKGFFVNKDDVVTHSSSQDERITNRGPPQIEELYFINAALLPLFSKYNYEKGSYLTPPEIRQVLKTYIKENNLQSEEQKNLINLDPVLSDILLNKNENNITRLKWEEAHSKCLDKMTCGYRVTLPGKQPTIRKGKLEPIELLIATRTANKKVTLVNNLEVYGIDPHELAHAVQIGVAASTSVSPAPNKKEGQQVLIQGNQIIFLANILQEDYQIPRKYIKGLELAPKKKKK